MRINTSHFIAKLPSKNLVALTLLSTLRTDFTFVHIADQRPSAILANGHECWLVLCCWFPLDHVKDLSLPGNRNIAVQTSLMELSNNAFVAEHNPGQGPAIIKFDEAKPERPMGTYSDWIGPTHD